ncbi:hypothetical protein D5266_01120 [bacterium c-19]|nr:hypothetical protein [bacterium c-19]
MKRLKVLCSLFGVSVLCCMGLITDVNAQARAVVYDTSANSSVHTYNTVKQYYVVTGTVTVVGTKSTISNVSVTWKSSGTGKYATDHGNVIPTLIRDNYRNYAGESRITINGVTKKSNLTAILRW